jgi:serine/threonine-protein kinase
MAPDHRPIDDLVRAVLDGKSVEWPDESSGKTGRLAAHLRVVAAIANAHRAGTSPAGGASPESSGPAPLQTWSHLRIVERIGRGAFGEVYRAWDARLEREVALKLLPVSSDDEETAAEMLREGRLLARVRHSNVVTIHGADHIDGYVGLWMELIEGRTLEDLIQAGEAPETGEVARIGIELARALGAVHAAGLLHRDVKAQNVMRTGEGRVVLMDFGAGRDLMSGGSDLTGTPMYLAPEVLGGQPATARSDIYSLGVLLHRLLTGSFPVSGETIREMRLAHERYAQDTRRSGRLHLPAPLGRVIERAIDPRPDTRYSSAGELCSALEAAAVSTSRRSWRTYAALALMVSLAWPAWNSEWLRDEERPIVSPSPPVPTREPAASTPVKAVDPPPADSREAINPELPSESRQTGDGRTLEPSKEERDSLAPEVVGNGKPGGRVVGTVTDESGRGVAGANLSFQDIRSYVGEPPISMGDFLARTTTIRSGPDGSYEVGPMPAGDYVLVVGERVELVPGCQGPSCPIDFRDSGPFMVSVLSGGTVSVPPIKLCGETSPSCRLLDTQFQHVLVPGFLTYGFQGIDANAETTAMFKRMLRDLHGPTSSMSEAAMSHELAMRLVPSPVNDENALAFGSEVFSDAPYMRRVGEWFRQPLITADTRPLIVTGSVVLVGLSKNASGQSYSLSTRIDFIDGRTGEIFKPTAFKSRIVVNTTRTLAAAYFFEMHRFMPGVFASIMKYIGRAYR